ncbi:ABC transporter substrate-binding protein [Oscillatoria sp. CS-180]|uniref:ABC transporter substrate-binding protein n=1 Tax=Oscillatoria sp. CS-180 TaxID=3021720 RepID=UPI00232D4043|nr:ABC transporter substrate-binding protein [Oscillatoria sp. CS-180]MDB9525529.1 ABC transporter substrate-binding protein [Oscillatoria sp. CS-180]
MQTQWLTRGFGIVLVGAIAACSSNPETPIAQESEVDAAETAESVEPAETVETVDKVVALTSLTADLVHTLDDERLVGIPGSPLLQEGDRFAGLEVVSEGRVEPDLEKIVALEPDLVIGAEGFHDKTLERLSELNVETLTVNVTGWEALQTLTEDLAQRLGADPQPLMDRYAACLAQAPETSPTALVLVSRQPLLSPNQDSWAGDFLKQFNLQNLTADLQGESPFEGYITLPEEQVLTADPDMLLVVETGDNLLEQLKGDAFWGQLKATQTDAVHTFDYFGLVNPGSLASIEATCDRLSQL